MILTIRFPIVKMLCLSELAGKINSINPALLNVPLRKEDVPVKVDE